MNASQWRNIELLWDKISPTTENTGRTNYSLLTHLFPFPFGIESVLKKKEQFNISTCKEMDLSNPPLCSLGGSYAVDMGNSSNYFTSQAKI
jgi:hypothetical protein